MNRDLTVLAVMLLMLFLEAAGAWSFLPGFAAGFTEWTEVDTLVIACSLAISALCLGFFTLAILRKIVSRI